VSMPIVVETGLKLEPLTRKSKVIVTLPLSGYPI